MMRDSDTGGRLVRDWYSRRRTVSLKAEPVRRARNRYSYSTQGGRGWRGGGETGGIVTVSQWAMQHSGDRIGKGSAAATPERATKARATAEQNYHSCKVTWLPLPQSLAVCRSVPHRGHHETAMATMKPPAPAPTTNVQEPIALPQLVDHKSRATCASAPLPRPRTLPQQRTDAPATQTKASRRRSTTRQQHAEDKTKSAKRGCLPLLSSLHACTKAAACALTCTSRFRYTFCDLGDVRRLWPT